MAKATIKYLGARKFPAQQYDLDSIPDNDRAGRDASSMMPHIRTSALFLRDSDGELEPKVRACGDDAERLDEWMNLLEGIGDALGAKRQDVEVLEAGFNRLLGSRSARRMVGTTGIEPVTPTMSR